MRRIQSAIIVMAMLAIPLALPARTGPCAQSRCSRLCALIMHSANAAASKHHRCICGMSAHGQRCPGRSSQQAPDYGLNAPIAPTILSAHASVSAPDFARRAILLYAEVPASGFRFELLQPPRA